jgi:hypothetical protein
MCMAFLRREHGSVTNWYPTVQLSRALLLILGPRAPLSMERRAPLSLGPRALLLILGPRALLSPHVRG